MHHGDGSAYAGNPEHDSLPSRDGVAAGAGYNGSLTQSGAIGGTGAPDATGAIGATGTIGAIGATGNAPAGAGLFAALDEDARAFAENKGWTKDHNPLGAVLKSYRELEARLGASLPLPKEDDAQGWRRLYGKLGMPESADGYELPVPEEHDPDVLRHVRGMFHEAGLSRSQAATLYGRYMAMAEPLVRQQKAEAEAGHKAMAEEAAAAARELGEARMSAARAAFGKFIGTNEVAARKLEAILGDGEMIRFFDRLARATGEDGKGAVGVRGGAGRIRGEASMRDIVEEAFARAGRGGSGGGGEGWG